jgi:hypothetical protein
MSKPAAMDLAKLTSDVTAALTIAREVAAKTDDGGTCNFDSPTLEFDRMPGPKARKQIEEAVNAAGLSGFWTKIMRCPVFVFGPGCGGQGNSRTAAAEAMRDHLKGNGWDVGMYYQCD